MRNETAEGTINIFHMGGTGDQIRGGNAESKIQMRLVIDHLRMVDIIGHYKVSCADVYTMRA